MSERQFCNRGDSAMPAAASIRAVRGSGQFHQREGPRAAGLHRGFAEGVVFGTDLIVDLDQAIVEGDVRLFDAITEEHAIATVGAMLISHRRYQIAEGAAVASGLDEHQRGIVVAVATQIAVGKASSQTQVRPLITNSGAATCSARPCRSVTDSPLIW